MKNWLGRIRSAKFLTAGFVHFGNAPVTHYRGESEARWLRKR